MKGDYININEEWRIGVEDGLNFVLEQKHIAKKTGKERWEDSGYYQDLEVLCLDLRDNMVRGSELDDSIESLIEAVRESTNEIKIALGESPLLDGING